MLLTSKEIAPFRFPSPPCSSSLLSLMSGGSSSFYILTRHRFLPTPRSLPPSSHFPLVTTPLLATVFVLTMRQGRACGSPSSTLEAITTTTKDFFDHAQSRSYIRNVRCGPRESNDEHEERPRPRNRHGVLRSMRNFAVQDKKKEKKDIQRKS
jgi:hypothetical protein